MLIVTVVYHIIIDLTASNPLHTTDLFVVPFDQWVNIVKSIDAERNILR
jgi:hypothetical protein